MKLRCRPGDLAVIISAKLFPAHLGRLVRVIRPANSAECWDPEGAWWVESLSAPFIVAFRGSPDGPIAHVALSQGDAVSDCRLRPIRGDVAQHEVSTSRRQRRPRKASAPTTPAESMPIESDAPAARPADAGLRLVQGGAA